MAVLLIVAIVILLVAVSAWLAFFPFVPRDLGGVADLDAEAERVSIPVGGEALEAWHLAGTAPSVVLLLHGHGRSHARMWRYAHFLKRAGHHVVAIDFRSSARARRRPTTLGRYELEDARAAVAWIRAHPGLGGCAIGLLGESLGGAVALVVAADDPGVSAVVNDSGFACGAMAIDDYFRRFLHLPASPRSLVGAAARLITGCDPCALDVRPAAAALGRRAVLFIHGEADRRVSPEQTRLLWTAAGGRHPVWWVPHAGHNQAWWQTPRAYEERVTAFFAEHLRVERVTENERALT